MLLDTSGLYALLDASEARHRRACEAYDAAPRRFTHSYVLAELVPLALVRRLDRRKVLMFIAALLTGREVEVLWPSPELYRRALQLLEARPDKDYSLCDAISFVLMREREESRALTTDHHFEQEGFIRVLPA